MYISTLLITPNITHYTRTHSNSNSMQQKKSPKCTYIDSELHGVISIICSPPEANFEPFSSSLTYLSSPHTHTHTYFSFFFLFACGSLDVVTGEFFAVN